jgi:hypothetical protein
VKQLRKASTALLFFIVGALIASLVQIVGSNFATFLIHNPEFLGIAFAILGIVASIITSLLIYSNQKSTREISWSIVSDTPVLSVNKELADDLQVLFHDHPISDARLVVLRLSNTGNVPILREDFDGAIRFEFGNETKILSAELISTEPAQLKDKVPFKVDAENISLGPLLLNSKDTIIFKVLVAGYQGNVNADARIAGINQISFKKGKLLSWAL